MSKTSKKSKEPKYTSNVVVKFDEYSEIPYDDEIETVLAERKLAPMAKLEERFPGITFQRQFTALEPDEIDDLLAEATKRDRTYEPANLEGYFLVTCPPDVDPEELAAELAEWEIVETAYVQPRDVVASVSAGDDPRSGNQGYLDPAPDGIDAEFAWTIPGATGTGQRLVDVEHGWTLDHEDLIDHGATLLHGTNADSGKYHGTAVLGEIGAVDNTFGCVGITPDTGMAASSTMGSTPPDAMLAAVANLSFGDVMLLELQYVTGHHGTSYVPLEVYDADFDVIRLASALGIVVVEAGANGGNDLDAYTNGVGDAILDRGSTDFRDSGAIFGGAASSMVPHSRMWFSNYGSRIDCYAWGENVDTCYSDTAGSTDLYTGSFSGTSSASPIVTGAALAVQGAAEANLGYRFSPGQLRELLSDPATGTPSADPANDEIGVMPDLEAIIQTELNVVPDVYLRDHVGDDGDPHSGPISASPDVILRQSIVADEQAAFGAGSGTENDAALGNEAEAGQDNYVYVRAQNRGGADATDVTATVYWSEVATLVTPDMWELVGEVTIPTVATGNQLTVSDAITWDETEIPGTGHYCFVGILGTEGDPAPGPADFGDWATFQEFVRENNNATWRNFNVVDNVPPTATPGFVALPFLAVGAHDRARPMGLEIDGRLPKGARAVLEMPEHVRALAEKHLPVVDGEDVEIDDVEVREDSVLVPVNPFSRTGLGEFRFPAKAKVDMTLHVRIPEDALEDAYDVAVVQRYEGEELGRVGWRLAPPREDAKMADGGIAIDTIHADAEAKPEAANLDDEYVVLENETDEAIDMSGWRLDYADDQTYAFPDGFTVTAGETVTVRTGAGEDTDDELFAGFNTPVLNNLGDVVTVFDEDGDVVATQGYGDQA